MQQTKRDQAHKLIELARSRDPATISQIVEALRLLFDDARDRLVSAQVSELESKQAEAKAYAKIIDMLTRPTLAKKGE